MKQFFFESEKITINKVDGIIVSLNRDDKRKLMTLIRSHHIMHKENLKSSLGFVKLSGAFAKQVIAAKIIIDLYEKAGCVEEEWLLHWRYYKSLQYELHMETKRMTKPERKDNKTSINYGSRNSNCNKIRYPSKKRKTAWKRFYKLFPHLKPKEVK